MAKAAAETIREGDSKGKTAGDHPEKAPPVTKGRAKPR